MGAQGERPRTCSALRPHHTSLPATLPSTRRRRLPCSGCVQGSSAPSSFTSCGRPSRSRSSPASARYRSQSSPQDRIHPRAVQHRLLPVQIHQILQRQGIAHQVSRRVFQAPLLLRRGRLTHVRREAQMSRKDSSASVRSELSWLGWHWQSEPQGDRGLHTPVCRRHADRYTTSRMLDLHPVATLEGAADHGTEHSTRVGAKHGAAHDRTGA